MKKVLILIVCLVTMVFAGGAKATTVTFNFDALNPGDGNAQISTYMTGVYGSTVTAAAVGQPHAEGIGILWNYHGDRYIESHPSGDQKITITFSTPITSVSFDWGSILDPFYADYSVDGTTFTNYFYDNYNIYRTGHLNTFTFPSPVTVLKFHDTDLGVVAIDNLVVEPVPEPATMLLLGSGLIGLAGFARRRFKK